MFLLLQQIKFLLLTFMFRRGYKVHKLSEMCDDMYRFVTTLK